jgi:hypothetical protein
MLDEAEQTLLAEAAQAAKEWKPPSIDERMGWGKHRERTYRDAAISDPGFCQWAAKSIPGIKGQLCAEALAIALGVTE